MKKKNQRCQVYLIHFEKSYYHAQHYIGFSSDLARRLFEHDTDQGSRLIAAINEIGIDWQVVRTWDVPAYDEGGLEFEVKLKKLKNARLLCPLCYKQAAERRARLSRSRRRRNRHQKPEQLKLPFLMTKLQLAGLLNQNLKTINEREIVR